LAATKKLKTTFRVHIKVEYQIIEPPRMGLCAQHEPVGTPFRKPLLLHLDRWLRHSIQLVIRQTNDGPMRKKVTRKEARLASKLTRPLR